MIFKMNIILKYSYECHSYLQQYMPEPNIFLLRTQRCHAHHCMMLVAQHSKSLFQNVRFWCLDNCPPLWDPLNLYKHSLDEMQLFFIIIEKLFVDHFLIHHDITKIRKIVLPGVDVVDVVDVEVDVAVVVVAVAEIIIKT